MDNNSVEMLSQYDDHELARLIIAQGRMQSVRALLGQPERVLCLAIHERAEAVRSLLPTDSGVSCYHTSVSKQLKVLLEESPPNLVVVDVDLPEINRLLYRLKFFYQSRFTPIIAFSDHPEQVDFRYLHRFGIKAILSLSDREGLAARIKDLLLEQRFANSYTNRFISSLVDYEGSRLVANRMIHLLERLEHDCDSHFPNPLDMRAVLGLLSVVVKAGSKGRVQRFFHEMQFAKPIEKLFQGALFSPKNDAEELLHALYCFELAIERGEKSDSVEPPIKRQAFLEMLRYYYQNVFSIVSSLADVDKLYEELLIAFSDQQVSDEAYITSRCKLLQPLLEELLLQLDNFMVKTEVDGEAIAIYLLTNDPVDWETLIQKNPDLDCYLVTPPPEENSPAEMRSLRVVFHYADEAGKQPEETVAATVSALEFLETVDTDAIIMDDFVDLEYELEALLSRTDDIDSQLISNLSLFLSRYASFIDSFKSFRTMSNALNSLVYALQQLKGGLGHDETLVTLFNSLIDDLRKWRESIFVYKNATDIHFLDQTFLSNAKQIEMLLSGNEGDEGEIEFF